MLEVRVPGAPHEGLQVVSADVGSGTLPTPEPRRTREGNQVVLDEVQRESRGQPPAPPRLDGSVTTPRPPPSPGDGGPDPARPPRAEAQAGGLVRRGHWGNVLARAPHCHQGQVHADPLPRGPAAAGPPTKRQAKMAEDRWAIGGLRRPIESVSRLPRLRD